VDAGISQLITVGTCALASGVQAKSYCAP
jgi:hypothetical protein